MVMNSLTPSTPSIPTSTAIHQQKSPTDSEQFTTSTNNKQISNCALILTPLTTTTTTSITPNTNTTSLLSITTTQQTINSNQKQSQFKVNQKSLLATITDPITTVSVTSTVSQQSSYSLDFLHSVGAQMTAGITRTPQTPLVTLSTPTPSVRYSSYFPPPPENSSQPTTTGRNIRSSFKFLQQSEIIDDDTNFLDLDFNYEPISGNMPRDGIISNNNSCYQVPNLNAQSIPGNSNTSTTNNPSVSGNLNITSENPRLYQTHPSESYNYYAQYRNHHYFYPHNWNNNNVNYQYRKGNSRMSSNAMLNNNQRLNNLNHQQPESLTLSMNSSIPYAGSYNNHQNVSKIKSPVNILDESIPANLNQQPTLSNFSRIPSPRYHSTYNFNNSSSFDSIPELSANGGGILNRMNNSGSNVRPQSAHLSFEKRSYLKVSSMSTNTDPIDINPKPSQMSVTDLESNAVSLPSHHQSPSLQHHHYHSQNNMNILSLKDFESDSSLASTIGTKPPPLQRHHMSHHHIHSHPPPPPPLPPSHLMERQLSGSLPSSLLHFGSSSQSEHFPMPNTDRPSFYETSHQYKSLNSDYNPHHSHSLPHQHHHHYHRHQQQNVGQHYNIQKTSSHNLYHHPPPSVSNRNSSNSPSGLSPIDSNYYVSEGNQLLLLPSKRTANSPSGHPKNHFRGRRYWYPNLRATHHNLHENSTPPDRFLAKAHLVETKILPAMLINGTKFDGLSQDIWNKFVQYQQREETYRRKIQLWKVLYLTIKKDHPRYGLYMVGSTISGFGTDSSDIDMCLVYRAAFSHDSRVEALSHLNYIKDYLSTLGGIFEQFHLIEAKVPILRFRDTQHMLEVDLNFNNCVGIRNTHLLYCYTQLDWRLRPLVLMVKLWAQYHHINNAKTMTISSYSLSLMVIHFLQCGVQPSVLPCLHELYPEKFKIILKSNDFGFVDMIEDIGGYESQNKQCIGELFIQFLQYYSTFDYAKYAISVRTGKLLAIDICRQAQSLKNDIHQWNELCIEEPFDLTNTARSVYDAETFERIKNVFIKSWKRIETSFDLNQIFLPMGHEYNINQQAQSSTVTLNSKPSTTTTNSTNSFASSTLQEIEIESLTNRIPIESTFVATTNSSITPKKS